MGKKLDKSHQPLPATVEEIADKALENIIVSIGQCQKGSARQFVHSVCRAAIAADRAQRWEELRDATPLTQGQSNEETGLP